MTVPLCRSVRFSITPHRINSGVPCSNGNCPVAIEARYRVPRAAASVLPEKILFAAGGETYVVPLPRAATEWIRKFDSGKPVASIVFDVEVPEVLFSLQRGVA